MRIKKYIYTFLLLFLFQFAIFAQKYTLGYQTGLSLSKLNYETVRDKWLTKPGFIMTLNTKYNLNKYFSITSGINYLSLNYELKDMYFFYDPNNYYSDDVVIINTFQPEWNLSYLRIPLLFTFRTPKKLSYNISIGGYYGRMLKNNISFLLDDKIPDTLKNDFGYIVGTGITYKINEQFELCFDYKNSFGQKYVIGNNRGKNSDYELTLGISYLLKSKYKSQIYNYKNIEEITEAKLSFNYLGGVTMNRDFGSNKDTHDMSVGFITGVGLQYYFGKMFSLSSGISFTRKGYSYVDTSYSNYFYGSFYDSNIQNNIDYLTVPLTINFYLNKSKNYYIGFGAYSSFLMNAREVGIANSRSKTEIDPNPSDNEETISFVRYYIFDHNKSIYKNTEQGWKISSGVEFPIFKFYKINLSAEYSSSFRNILKEPDENESIKLRTIIISCGFKIPII